MARYLPLLLFPKAKSLIPPTGDPKFIPGPHLPSHQRQSQRLLGQMNQVRDNFISYRAELAASPNGLEPETVLVIEIAGSVSDFKQAVEAVDLEWLGEWDIDDVGSDDDFYVQSKIGVDYFKGKITNVNNRAESKTIQQLLIDQHFLDEDGEVISDDWNTLVLPSNLNQVRSEIIELLISSKNNPLSGQLFLSVANEAGINTILRLWNQWNSNQELPTGQKKWRDVFNRIKVIRKWGLQETIGKTQMENRWRSYDYPLNPAELVSFQIEFFYRKSIERRLQNVSIVSDLLRRLDGRIIGSPLDIRDISFHAVKAQIPASSIQRLLDQIDQSFDSVDIELFKFPGIMYFRPTGQSLTNAVFGEGEHHSFESDLPTLPPVAAIFDGVPYHLHDHLADRLVVDDPDDLSAFYAPGQRRHGTSMASLVVHGELDDNESKSLNRKIYHRPIMQPHPYDRNTEHVPEDVFLEDRIQIAVIRMLKGYEGVEAQSPDVKIINFSIGDTERPFIHIPSPLARLLDWLSWKYRILFCVSAGNFCEDIDIDISVDDFARLSGDEKVIHVLKSIDRQMFARRLLSPAEAFNVLTVGASHADKSGAYVSAGRTDLISDLELFSPMSRIGYGFRQSIKPEVLFPGGRQLYQAPLTGGIYKTDVYKKPPGQKVAYDGSDQGSSAYCLHTRGTSNSTALATRSAVLIHDVLLSLNKQEPDKIPDELLAVTIKALLVHGARHNETIKPALMKAFSGSRGSASIKKILSRYIGYGTVDIRRVLECTQQRGTVIGCGEISQNELHEYRLPLPPSLSERTEWRRLVITLAWFSPINPDHRNLREAKLEVSPALKWDSSPLKVTRQDADHNQIHKGTIQHEVFEGVKEIQAFKDGEHMVFHISCRADATNSLDVPIPYGLAITLEVKEGVDIEIYEELRARIAPKIGVLA